MTEQQSLRKAIELAGGQKALASKLTALAHKKGLLTKTKKIQQQHINNWINREKRCATRWALLVCEAVNHEVKPSELRPDLYPLSDTA